MYLCPGWDTALMEEIKSIGHELFFLSATMIEPIASSNAVIEKNYGQDIANFQEEKLLQEYSQFEKKDWSGATWPPNILPVARCSFLFHCSYERRTSSSCCSRDFSRAYSAKMTFVTSCSSPLSSS